MIAAFITFLVLYGLLYALERKRTEVDGFSIATVAGVPVLCVVLVSVVLGFAYPDPLLLATLPLATLLIATFLLLRKMMEMPVGRSLAYTGVVLVVHVAVSMLFAAG